MTLVKTLRTGIMIIFFTIVIVEDISADENVPMSFQPHLNSVGINHKLAYILNMYKSLEH